MIVLRSHFQYNHSTLDIQKLSYSYTLLKNLSFSEQVNMFYNSDIVLAPHGAALVNIMFCTPHSVLIECTPPYFFELWYINTACLSNLHYISVTTYYPNNNTFEPWVYAENAYFHGFFVSKRRAFLNNAIDPPLVNIINAVSDAISYLLRWRFSYSSSPEWSPLFYQSILWICASFNN